MCWFCCCFLCVLNLFFWLGVIFWWFFWLFGCSGNVVLVLYECVGVWIVGCVGGLMYGLVFFVFCLDCWWVLWSRFLCVYSLVWVLCFGLLWCWCVDFWFCVWWVWIDCVEFGWWFECCDWGKYVFWIWLICDLFIRMKWWLCLVCYYENGWDRFKFVLFMSWLCDDYSVCVILVILKILNWLFLMMLLKFFIDILYLKFCFIFFMLFLKCFSDLSLFVKIMMLLCSMCIDDECLMILFVII